MQFLAKLNEEVSVLIRDDDNDYTILIVAHYLFVKNRFFNKSFDRNYALFFFKKVSLNSFESDSEDDTYIVLISLW